MKTGLRFTVSISCISLLVIYLACSSHDITGGGTLKAKKANALDCILLSEHSDEIGPLIFAHYKHYGPKNNGMNGIACKVCHFCAGDSRKEPLQACRRCHFPHDEAGGRKAPSL
ncbi:MAG: hypothetical protein ACYS8W_08635 [Planctomycetota bacterium]